MFNHNYLIMLQTCCAGKPYLATHDATAPELGPANMAPSAGAAAAADWLFQPIAEDESGFDEETLEAIIGGGGGAATDAAGEAGTNKV